MLGRHGTNGNVGRGFVKGFGLTRGAIASSVGHDSHNVCVIGCRRCRHGGGGEPADRAAGRLRRRSCDGQVTAELALPIAGLMSDRPFEEVEQGCAACAPPCAAMGMTLHEPFLQMAFLPLPVIPHLKITDKGLVDVDKFELVA